ncbi:hypothetical protein SAMN04488523_102337 [Sulfitobacter brevis]|uniref:Uncharacterized protein n=1 Tax=Sulfitobacter brevis TaxID=74348 RepID=A0A1I1V8X9_9RHOB|nr:hypothetical protein [Sulfitobacter brevis]SFD76860.1 hypothetical protein SAMN04488523_102337 [Sulfitobacter brevis]
MSLISPIFGGRTSAPPPKAAAEEPVTQPVQEPEATTATESEAASADTSEQSSFSGNTSQGGATQQSSAAQAANASQVSSNTIARADRALAEPAPAQGVADEARARVAAERRIEAAQARILIDQIMPVSNAPQGFKSYMSVLLSSDTAETSSQSDPAKRAAA